MFDQTELLPRLLTALDLWPTPAHIQDNLPPDIIDRIAQTLPLLDKRHLLAILWVTMHLYIHQSRPIT